MLILRGKNTLVLILRLNASFLLPNEFCSHLGALFLVKSMVLPILAHFFFFKKVIKPCKFCLFIFFLCRRRGVANGIFSWGVSTELICLTLFDHSDHQ